MELESRGLKVVPLEAVFEGSPAPNFEKLTQILSPSKVTLSGKPQELEKITKITLPEISITDRKEPFAKTFKIPDPGKGLSLVGAKEVTINVNIIPMAYKIGEQVATGIPIQCVGLDNRLEAELSEDQIAIKYFSSKPFRSGQILLGIQAQVPCNAGFETIRAKLASESSPQTAKVRLIKSRELKGIEILQINPEKIEIRYKLKEGILEFPDPLDEQTN